MSKVQAGDLVVCINRYHLLLLCLHAAVVSCRILLLLLLALLGLPCLAVRVPLLSATSATPMLHTAAVHPSSAVPGFTADPLVRAAGSDGVAVDPSIFPSASHVFVRTVSCLFFSGRCPVPEVGDKFRQAPC
jgi:hypothetical protein